MKDALTLFASHFTPPGPVPGRTWSFCIPSLTGSADAFLALTLAVKDTFGGQNAECGGNVVLAVTPGLPDADRLADDLRLLTRDKKLGTDPYATRILEFPPPLDGDKSALGTRLKTIAALKAWELNPYPCVVVAAFPALSCPVAGEAEPIRLMLGRRTNDSRQPTKANSIH